VPLAVRAQRVRDIVRQCLIEFTWPEMNMKKLLCALALMVGSSAVAQAQVYFGPGSVRPINPAAATRDLDRQERVRPAVKVRQKLVRCRDGSKHIARLCRGHGGVAVR
jgi:hypothetical protein